MEGSKTEGQNITDQREIYSKIFPIIKSTADEVFAERLQNSGLNKEDADNTKALIDTLPDPSSATSLEMRIILHEANAGMLETFWYKYGQENIPKLRKQYDSHGGNYSEGEMLELSKSSMWPALQKLRPDTYRVLQK